MAESKPVRPGYPFIALCKPKVSTILVPINTFDYPLGIGATTATECLDRARRNLAAYVKEQHEDCEYPIEPEFRDPAAWEIAIAEVKVISTHDYEP